jgi:hypothetical protein
MQALQHEGKVFLPVLYTTDEGHRALGLLGWWDGEYQIRPLTASLGESSMMREPLSAACARATHLSSDIFQSFDDQLLLYYADLVNGAIPGSNNLLFKDWLKNGIILNLGPDLDGRFINGVLALDDRSLKHRQDAVVKKVEENRRLLKTDLAFMPQLDEKARSALRARVLRIPEWSLAQLYMSPAMDAFQQHIDPDLRVKMDEFVRRNLHQQDWLRDVFGAISQLYLLQVNQPNASAARYLEIASLWPDMEQVMREHILASIPDPLGPFQVTCPLSLLRQPASDSNNLEHRPEFKSLPAMTQFFLIILGGGYEDFLKEEAERVPTMIPRHVFQAQGSLAKLIAVGKTLTEAKLRAGGLSRLEKVYPTIPEKASLDVSDVTGAVNNQETTAPIWPRELIQNARNILRRMRRLDSHGRNVEPAMAHAAIHIRSYTHTGRWIVSVSDPIGMTLDRIVKKLLTPDATTEELQFEVREILDLSVPAAEKAQILLETNFKPEGRENSNIRDQLTQIFGSKMSKDKKVALILARFENDMKRVSGGFMGQGFFTVFADADQLLIRSGHDGKLYEVLLVPVRDPGTGQIKDIHVVDMKEYDDPQGEFKGTEIQRIKTITEDNLGRIQMENAYLRFQATKHFGAISDYDVLWNGVSILDPMREVAQHQGVRSRLSKSGIVRATVDELYVESPEPFLMLVPKPIRKALLDRGWNLDFEIGTPLVRTRNRIQSPQTYQPRVAVVALKSAAVLYRDSQLAVPRLMPYRDYLRISSWKDSTIPEWIRKDAELLNSQADETSPSGREFWQRFERDYVENPSNWANLMLIIRLPAANGSEMSLQEERARANRGALSDEADGLDHLRHHPAAKAAIELLMLIYKRAELPLEPPPAVELKDDLLAAYRLFMAEQKIAPFVEQITGITEDGGIPELAVQVYDAWLNSGVTKAALFEALSRASAPEGVQREALMKSVDDLRRQLIGTLPVIVNVGGKARQSSSTAHGAPHGFRIAA